MSAHAIYHEYEMLLAVPAVAATLGVGLSAAAAFFARADDRTLSAMRWLPLLAVPDDHQQALRVSRDLSELGCDHQVRECDGRFEIWVYDENMLKYRPEFPERFGSIEDGRAFSRSFFGWYNRYHHHTGIGLLTPKVVHYGPEEVIRARHEVLLAAYEAHPERFVRKPPEAPARSSLDQSA